MISRRPRAARQVEVDRAVEAARAAAARGRGRRRGWSRRSRGCWPAPAAASRSWRCGGQEAVDPVDEPAADLRRRSVGSSNDCSWMSSSLTTPAMPSPSRGRRCGRGHRAAIAPRGAGDGVDLLDEADGAALLAGRLAQRLEVASGSCGSSGRSTSTGTPTTTRTGTARRPRAPWPWPCRSCRCRAGPRRGSPGAACRPSAPGTSCSARKRLSVLTTSSCTTPRPDDVVERRRRSRSAGTARAASGRRRAAG